MSDGKTRTSHTPDWTYTVRSDASWVNANGAIYNVTREHAPLIAAAPDLYEALRLCQQAFRTISASNGATREAEQAIRSALAKAEGRDTGDDT